MPQKSEGFTVSLTLTKALRLLRVLCNSPVPLSGTELSQELGLNISTATRLLTTLEREGYVSRRPSPDDKRWVVLFLTAKGERAVAQTLSAIAAHDRKMTSALSPAERTALLALLRKLGRSLPAPRPAKNGSSVRPAMPE